MISLVMVVVINLAWWLPAVGRRDLIVTVLIILWAFRMTQWEDVNWSPTVQTRV